MMILLENTVHVKCVLEKEIFCNVNFYVGFYTISYYSSEEIPNDLINKLSEINYFCQYLSLYNFSFILWLNVVWLFKKYETKKHTVCN